MHVSLGRPSPIEMTARHLANRAPRETYSSNRERSPSTLGHELAQKAGKGACPLVHLDARNHALRAQRLWERDPVRRALPDCLVEEDHATNRLADPVGREQDLTIFAAPLLGRLEPDAAEALFNRTRALVRGENSLPRRHEGARCVGHRCEVHH